MIVAARTVHFASTMLLVGGLLFALAVATPIWREIDGAAHGSGETVLRKVLGWAGWILAASVVSGAIWLVVEAADMSGKPLAQAIGSDTLGVVLTSTVFGRLWIGRFALALVSAALLIMMQRSAGRLPTSRLAAYAALVALVYLASLAWSGHAAAAQMSGPSLALASDVVHLLAAGAWVGGLPGLVLVLRRRESIRFAAEVVRRFSALSIVSVGALIASGVGNAWYLVGDLPALIGTAYGRLLAAKLVLFTAMVALAAVNRFSLSAQIEASSSGRLRAGRVLARNAAIEAALGMIIVAIVGALGTMIPAAHQSPVWPFAHTLSWQVAAQSVSLGAKVVAAGCVALIAAAFASSAIVRKRWRLGVAGFLTSGVAVLAWAWLLRVPAYPTTYAMPPVPYSPAAIVRGARLYTQNCAACHGRYGRGDGPAATTVAIVPTDLAAHASGHRPGDLFWWITHGIAGTPMPSFAPRLSSADVWDLVQFLRAQSDAASATRLTNHVQPWEVAVTAPDFAFELAGQGQKSLRQAKGYPVTLLVLYTLPQSLSYLRALGQTSALEAIGLHVVAIPVTENSATTEVGGDDGSILAMASKDVAPTYAMFARQETNTDNTPPTEVDYLIDRQGYIRARWIGVPDAPAARIAEAFDQAEILFREPRRAPLGAHTH